MQLVNEFSANATLTASHKLEETVLNAADKDEFAIKTNKQLQETLKRLKALEVKGNENITRIKEAQNILEDHNDRINNIFANVESADSKTTDAAGVVNEFAEKVQALRDRVEALNNFNERNIKEQISNGMFKNS